MINQKLNFESFNKIETEKEPEVKLIASSKVPEKYKENPFSNSYFWGMADWENKELYLPDNSDEAISFSIASHELGHLVEKGRIQPDRENFDDTYQEELRAWEVGWNYLEKHLADYYNNPRAIQDLKSVKEKIKDRIMSITLLTEPFYKNTEKVGLKQQREYFLQTEQGRRIKDEADGLKEFVKKTLIDLEKESFLKKIDWTCFSGIVKKALLEIEKDNKSELILDDNILKQKNIELRELFKNFDNPISILLKEMESDIMKEKVDSNLLDEVKRELINLEYFNQDDFVNKVLDIGKPIWEITQKDKKHLHKQEGRDMFTAEDLSRAFNIIKKISAQKIYVVGNVGSGKTTFSRELSQEVDFKNIDLDRYFKIFEQEKGKVATVEELVDFVLSREKPPYIINHTALLSRNLIHDADLVVLLNPKKEELIKSREIRQTNQVEGEWQNISQKNYKKIERENLEKLESLKGDIVYDNKKSGTIIKVLKK